MQPRIGSLCSGYGGLDTAVIDALGGGQVAWHAQYEPPDKDGRPDRHQWAAQILAHHHPGVPNHGDITTIDFRQVEPVDILTAGFPCTDISLAGRRTGLRAGTRSGIWTHVARAIAELRPSLVAIENVRSLTSANADSDMEPCTWCLGDGGDESVLRALGAVLGDLADLGFDAEWTCLRASDVGAPHQRHRIFILARPAEDADSAARGQWRVAAPGQAEDGRPRGDARGRGGAPASDAGREPRAEDQPHGAVAAGRGGAATHTDGHAIRQQSVAVGGRGGSPIVGVAGTEAASDAQGVGRREGRTEPAGQLRGLDVAVGGGATPADADRDALGPERHGEPAQQEAHDGRHRVDASGRFLGWGPYGPAVARWEHILGRPAPSPVDQRGRLAPAFVEWMMGLPAGWVTDVPGIPRNAQLKALGNGVVPQQGAAAFRILHERLTGRMPERSAA